MTRNFCDCCGIQIIKRPVIILERPRADSTTPDKLHFDIHISCTSGHGGGFDLCTNCVVRGINNFVKLCENK